MCAKITWSDQHLAKFTVLKSIKILDCLKKNDIYILETWNQFLTHVEVVGLSPIKCPSCFLGQETLPLLLSTGWFQEQFKHDFTVERI